MAIGPAPHRRLRVLPLRDPVARPTLAHHPVVRPHDHGALRPALRDRSRAALHAGGHGPGERGRARLVGRVDDREATTGGRAPQSVRAAERRAALAARPRGRASSPREVDAAGDTLYQTFCTVCHGAAGDGKGPVGPRVGAPSLLTGRARGYSDGYLYSIIRYGRGVMPRYGDKVYLPADRWAIVNHLRKLQAASPAPQEPAGAAVGIPPAPSATGSTSARPR